MFETLGLEGWTPLGASVVLGVLLGLAFGALAQRSRFCLRRGLVGAPAERASALATWAMALAVAVAGTGGLMAAGLVDFGKHRFLASDLPLAAIVLGGVLFGIGMVLTRGCTSRLSVLAGSGNLRAWVALVVFAVVAHATLKGVLAPLRVWLGGFTVPLGGSVSLASLWGGLEFWSAVVAVGLVSFALVSGARLGQLAFGAAIGALVPLGWVGTGYVLQDAFSPITLESLAFTSSAAETLFYAVASTAIAPTFGLGVFGGTIAGAAMAALATREFQWTGFTHDTPASRYLAGGALMGVGGVLAGGCTIGAGLSGVATLSFASILALASIAGGALAANAWARAGDMTAAGHGALVAAE